MTRYQTPADLPQGTEAVWARHKERGHVVFAYVSLKDRYLNPVTFTITCPDENWEGMLAASLFREVYEVMEKCPVQYAGEDSQTGTS